MRLQVDHAAAADGCRRRLLQVRRLEYEALSVAHLDDFAAHQTQLQRAKADKRRQVTISEEMHLSVL